MRKAGPSEQWHWYRVAALLHCPNEQFRHNLRRTIYFQCFPDYRCVSFYSPPITRIGYEIGDHSLSRFFQLTRASLAFPAKRLDFEIIYELPYEHMHLKKRKFEVFRDCHPENYSLACMALKMSPPRAKISVALLPSIAEKPASKRKKVDREK